MKTLRERAASGGEMLSSALLSVDPIDRRMISGILYLYHSPFMSPVSYRKLFRLILNLDGLAC